MLPCDQAGNLSCTSTAWQHVGPTCATVLPMHPAGVCLQEVNIRWLPDSIERIFYCECVGAASSTTAGVLAAQHSNTHRPQC